MAIDGSGKQNENQAPTSDQPASPAHHIVACRWTDEIEKGDYDHASTINLVFSVGPALGHLFHDRWF
jgi:hypothetical protein